MTTWGEGGLSFPTEDAVSTPTATSPSAETQRHSLAKELGRLSTATCTHNSET